MGGQSYTRAALPPGKTRYLTDSIESNSAEKLHYA